MQSFNLLPLLTVTLLLVLYMTGC